MINVTYVNNNGGGFPDTKAVEDGTTFGEFVQANISGGVTDYRIRLNGEIAAHDVELEDGDKVVVTPLKVDGGS